MPIVLIGGHRSSCQRRAQSELDRTQERNLVPLKVHSFCGSIDRYLKEIETMQLAAIMATTRATRDVLRLG
jgi:hypothetical protein